MHKVIGNLSDINVYVGAESRPCLRTGIGCSLNVLLSIGFGHPSCRTVGINEMDHLVEVFSFFL